MGNNVTTVAARGTPWAMIAFVGLLIAKFGFGVPISWLWVLAPFWIPFAIIVGLFLIVAVVYLLVVAAVAVGSALKNASRRSRQKPRLV